MSKLVDKERLARLAQGLDARAKAAVEAERVRAEGAEAALNTKITKNTGDIAGINHATTGILAQSKTYTDGAVAEVNGTISGLETRVEGVEAKDISQDAAITKNTSDLNAEVIRAKAAEEANATAIAKEITDRTGAVAGVEGELAKEITRAKAAEEANATAITNEISRATAAEKVNADAIKVLNGANNVAGSVAKTVKDAVDPLKTAQETLDGRVTSAEASIATNATAITEGDAATLVAAKAYADTTITNLVGGAPEAMNTLKELADAIVAHEDVYQGYVETVAADLARKVDKVDGSRLITNEEVAKFNAKAEVSAVTAAITTANTYTDEAIAAVNGDNAAVVGRVNALETTVGGASSGLVKDVADIKAKNVAQDTAITNAQSQADKGVADAATAQTQANKGVADAAAAQSRADKGVADAAKAQTGVDSLTTLVGDADSGLVKKVNDNTSAIAAINNATTGILKQSKDYTNTQVNGVTAEVGKVKESIAAIEAVNASQTEDIARNTSDLAAEVTRAKAAEKVNNDAIKVLNGTGAGSVVDSIATALAPYSDTAEVKTIIGNVVGSLNLALVDNKVSLKLGGVEGITLTETTLDLATDADIDAIISGLDAGQF